MIESEADFIIVCSACNGEERFIRTSTGWMPESLFNFIGRHAKDLLKKAVMRSGR